MAMRSITKRWLYNSMSLILVILIVILIVSAYSIKSYYYNGVRQSVESRATVMENMLGSYAQSGSGDYDDQVRSLVEEFSDKDKMELMAIDQSGGIPLTSSGFAVEEKMAMPDYYEALENGGRGSFTGLSSTGENIFAVTLLTPVASGEITALRLVTSLEAVDRQIVYIIIVLTALGIAIIFFVVLTSSYFIKSIVRPVGKLGAVAKRIASGDFEARIEKKHDDEIGELCDVINYMAGELGSTETMKNDFISSVSHELRTPLTAIQGWAETIQGCVGSPDEADRETAEKGVQVIINEAGRLTGMVEELLDFSRMQSGRLVLVKDKMDLVAELSEAYLMFTQRALRENIRIDYDEPEIFSPVFGDKNRLRQVFINIIENALKYSDAGDVITISAEETGGKIKVTIADTGCGIKAEDLPKVKTKFFKGNSTRRGSGIGLAVADEIVRLHEGTLEIESEENVGTTVTITLPVIQKRGDGDSMKIVENTAETPRDTD